ncbi:MAG TPA: inorganic phosphate transporter [Thermoleophilia bacterium]|nr:inorganic phosphate transporter [Thermoleophilia bacterium]
MSGGTGLLIAVVAVALFFDLLNGFHDGCNAVSTVIYTGALKPKIAIGLSAIFNFVGPLVMGVAVAKTIGGVIQAGDATAHLVIAALLGACVWEILTWLWALPMSSSHALVGGLLGAGVAALGLDGINWNKVILVFVSLFASPFLGIVTGYALMRISRFAFAKLRMDLARADRFYKRMQIVSSSWVSFSHGSNDATKVMGIIIIFLAAREGLGVNDYVTQHGFPYWVILSFAGAMAVGTFISVRSFRLIRTLGEKITKLHPINGFSAECGGAIIIQLASLLGLPVSTTHVVTSAVTGTGLASQLGGVSWKVFRAIMLAWVVTLPFCAAVAAIIYFILNLVM